MPETVGCPECTRKLLVPEELLGKLVRCPTCGATFTADASAPPAAPPPPRVVEEQSAPPPEESSPGPPERRLRRRYADDQDDEDRPRWRGRRDLEPHRGALVLVFGILALVACPVFGPVAWVLGNQDLAAIRARRMDPEGEGLTRAGQICGIIGTGFLVLNVLVVFLMMLSALH